MPRIQRPGQVSAARGLAWLRWRTTGDDETWRAVTIDDEGG
jgi:hypothetical protein